MVRRPERTNSGTGGVELGCREKCLENPVLHAVTPWGCVVETGFRRTSWLRRRRGDVAVDADEAVRALGAAPLRLQAEVEVRRGGPVERPLLAAVRAVVVEFTGHTGH